MGFQPKNEALEVIKAEIGKKADDKRTKIHKALKQVEKSLEIDEEQLMAFIEEFLKEYGKENGH